MVFKYLSGYLSVCHKFEKQNVLYETNMFILVAVFVKIVYTIRYEALQASAVLNKLLLPNLKTFLN